jgi:hypothetical protein
MKNSKLQLLNRVIEHHRSRQRYFLSSKANKELTKVDLESFEKGTAFESFVVRHFDPDYFTLIEWRSDKTTDGIYPVMSMFPDLELYFESNSKSLLFAVECKWMNTFYREQIKLNRYQLENYRNYENEMQVPTFLIIGIGNIPSNPNNVYVIPLRDISNDYLNEFEMGVYKRPQPHKDFYLDCQNLFLR